MWKYKLVDGTLINVPKEKIQKFLGENPGARLILAGESSVDKSVSSDSTLYNVGGQDYEVSKEKEEQFLSDFEGQQVFQVDKVLGKRVLNIQHVSANDLSESIGDSWWTKEGNAAEFLNNHYRYKQNLDVTFVETKAGYNQLKMIVKGIEIDKPIDLTKTSHMNEEQLRIYWGDLQKNIQLKIEDEFGDKERKVNTEKELLNKVSSVLTKENILDFDLSGKNQAEFAHTLDKAFNADKLVKNWYFEKKEGAGNIYQTGVNRISTGGEYNGKQY